MISYNICLSLSDISLKHNALQVHPCCCKWQNFILFFIFFLNLVKELWDLNLLLTLKPFPATIIIGGLVIFGKPAEWTAKAHCYCCSFPSADVGLRKMNSWNCFSSQSRSAKHLEWEQAVLAFSLSPFRREVDFLHIFRAQSDWAGQKMVNLPASPRCEIYWRLLSVNILSENLLHALWF